MMKTITCTEYKGALSTKQVAALTDLLWDYLRPVKGKDQVYTGFGTKTLTGLLYTIENICEVK